MITNPKKGMSPAVLETPWKTMKGVEFIFEKKLSKNWQMIASYHYTKATGNTDNVQTSLGTSPNNYVNSSDEMVLYYGQPHQFKLQGNIVLPLDISVGVTGQYITGQPVQVNFITIINGQYAYFRMYKMGELKWGPNEDVSMKIEKRFRIGDRFMLTGFADIYNLFNFYRKTYLTTPGPNFGKITAVQAPRSYRIGFRAYF
jgi:hypothetical protein